MFPMYLENLCGRSRCSMPDDGMLRHTRPLGLAVKPQLDPLASPFVSNQCGRSRTLGGQCQTQKPTIEVVVDFLLIEKNSRAAPKSRFWPKHINFWPGKGVYHSNFPLPGLKCWPKSRRSEPSFGRHFAQKNPPFRPQNAAFFWCRKGSF